MKPILFLSFFLCFSASYAQQKFTISGIINDLKTNETLFGVSVYVEETKTGGLSNEYGFYSITLPEGEYILRVSYLGFEAQERKISLTSNQKINFSLAESDNQLEEVTIKSEKNYSEIKK